MATFQVALFLRSFTAYGCETRHSKINTVTNAAFRVLIGRGSNFGCIRHSRFIFCFSLAPSRLLPLLQFNQFFEISEYLILLQKAGVVTLVQISSKYCLKQQRILLVRIMLAARFLRDQNALEELGELVVI